MTVVDLPWTPIDPVGEALHHLRVTGVFYSRTEADGPWAVEMPAFGDCVSFHVVTVGEAWVQVEGGPPVRLVPGDLALVPHGRGHLLLSAPGVPSLGRVDELPQEFLSPNYSVLRHQGSGSRVELICGVLSVDGAASRLLLDLLPSVVHVDGRQGGAWMAATLALTTEELTHARPGGEAVTTRLADILVIQSIRAWLDAQEVTTGWLGALRDPAARRRDHRRAPRAGPAVDRRDDGARGGDVPVRVLGTVHRGRRRARDAVRDPRPDARRGRPARLRPCHRARGGRRARVRLGGVLQPRVQA